jgi:outer membrane protein OmpA-like peptidoglycan-associated protein
VLVAGVALGLLTPVALGSAGPTASAAPSRDTAPVLDIVAPVLDITFATADLKREARVEKKPKQVKVTLDSTVLFAKDSPRINAAARSRLRDVGSELKSEGPGSVTITGYTDDLGTAAHGLTLSRRRAAAVAQELRGSLPAGGFPFTVVGKGEADPAVPNASEANRRINRRVVILYRAS